MIINGNFVNPMAIKLPRTREFDGRMLAPSSGNATASTSSWARPLQPWRCRRRSPPPRPSPGPRTFNRTQPQVQRWRLRQIPTPRELLPGLSPSHAIRPAIRTDGSSTILPLLVENEPMVPVAWLGKAEQGLQQPMDRRRG